MTSKIITEITWLEYITKLNDRELNRRRASGVTQWALLGLLGVISFRILNDFPTFLESSSNSYLVLLFLTNILNVLYTLLFFALAIAINLFLQETRRLTTQISKRSSQLITWPLLIVVVLLGFLNFFISMKASPLTLQPWSYIGIGSFISLNLFIHIKDLISLKLKKKNIQYPETPLHAAYTDPSKRKIASTLLLIFGIVLLFLSVYSFQNLFAKDYVVRYITLIKASLNIAVFLLIILILLAQLGMNIRYSWLQNMEIRILTEQLSADQIRLLFIQEYLGPTTLEWIKNIKSEISEKYEYFKKVISEIEPELEGIKDINKKYRYEIEGRRNEVKEKAKKAIKEFLVFQLEKLGQISLFWKQAGFTKDEGLLFDITFDESKNQIKEIGDRWNSIMERFDLEKIK